jgi:hypothetical protein
MIQDLINSKNIDSVNLGFTLLISQGCTPHELKQSLIAVGKNFNRKNRVTIKYSEKMPCWESKYRRRMKKSTTFTLVENVAKEMSFLFKHRTFARQHTYSLSNISFESIKEIKIK